MSICRSGGRMRAWSGARCATACRWSRAACSAGSASTASGSSSRRWAGDTALGLLAVGWSLGQRLAGVTAMLVTAAAFPLAVRRFATQSREEALRQFGAGGTLLVGIVVPAAVGLWQVSPLLVDLMIAAPFRPVTLAILPAAVITGAIRNLRVHYADQTFLLFERTGIGVVIQCHRGLARDARRVHRLHVGRHRWRCRGLPRRDGGDGLCDLRRRTAALRSAAASGRLGSHPARGRRLWRWRSVWCQAIQAANRFNSRSISWSAASRTH